MFGIKHRSCSDRYARRSYQRGAHQPPTCDEDSRQLRPGNHRSVAEEREDTLVVQGRSFDESNRRWARGWMLMRWRNREASTLTDSAMRCGRSLSRTSPSRWIKGTPRLLPTRSRLCLATLRSLARLRRHDTENKLHASSVRLKTEHLRKSKRIRGPRWIWFDTGDLVL